MPDEPRTHRVAVVSAVVLSSTTVLTGVVVNLATERISWWAVAALVAIALGAAGVDLALGRLAGRQAGRADTPPGPEVSLAAVVFEAETEKLDRLVRRPLTHPGQDEDDPHLPVEWADWSPAGPGPERHDAWTDLPDSRRLVILGAPGAGKSVMTMRIARARARGAGLVPVRGDLAGLSSALAGRMPAEEAVRRLDDWLARQIVARGVPPSTAARLVEQGRIVAVLDGLDEVDEATTPRVIEVLNSERAAPRGRLPVVLACRTDRYERLSGERIRLVGSHVIEVLPLEPAAVAGELERHGAGREIVTELRKAEPGGGLVALLRAPLHLSLLIDLDAGRTPTVPADPAGLRDAIFERYLDAVVERDPSTPYAAEQVRRWLTVIARHRDRAGTGSFTVPDLRRAALPGLIRAVTVGLGLLIAVLVVAVVLPPLLPPEIRGGTWEARARGTGIGFVLGGLLLGDRFAPRLRILIPGDRRDVILLVRAAVDRAFAGAALGAFIALIAGLVRNEPFLTGFVGYTAVTFAAAGALLGLVRGVDLRPPARTRRRMVHQGAAGLAAIMLLGVAGGVLVNGGGVAELVPAAAGRGLLYGLAAAGLTVWPAYAVACLIHTLLQEVHLPARPATFLDWAHDAGLIRATGTADQIRHQALRDWLAARR